MTGRPGPDEYADFYAGYVAATTETDLADALRRPGLAALVRGLDPSLAGTRYAPDKWTLAGVVQHVIDTEWVFATRALRIARGDRTPLPGFDQEPYAEAAPDRPLAALADELDRLRASTVDLFASLPADALLRVGVASGHPLSARAAGWIVAGHERHHLGIVRERYLG
ncbi:DinB family protein [Rubrivirga sp.]|uniref:DinB family protein n=1 Tax=Rubrivirga sp. TaxID=1885344 RepID=UPI003B5212FA